MVTISISDLGTSGSIYPNHRERFREVTANEQSFIIKLPRPTWYLEQNDKCGMTGGGSRNIPKYMDAMFRNCVIDPAEVMERGMTYFNEQGDCKTPEALAKEIEGFIEDELDICVRQVKMLAKGPQKG